MDQHLMANAGATQSMQQAMINPTAPSNQNWPLGHDDVSPKTTNTTAGYMQSFDAAVTAPIPGASTVAFNTHSFDIPSSAAYTPQNFSHVASSAYPQPYPAERVPSNDQQTTPVWDPSGIFSQWNTAFGPQPTPGQPSPPTAQYQQPPSTASLLRQPLPQQNVSAGMQASFYQPPPVPPSAVRPPPQQQQQAQVPGAQFAPMQTVTPNMWQDAFTSAYVSGHKRYRDDSVDLTGMYDPYGSKRRG